MKSEIKREYQTAKGWRIFTYILTPPMLILFGWVGYLGFTSEMESVWLSVFLILISLLMMAVFVIGLIDMKVGRLIIYPDKFVKVNWLKKVELPFSKVKGFIATDPNYVFIYPKDENHKTIKVSRYFGQKSEWLMFLEENFSDMEAEKFKTEEKELLDNEELGNDKVEREYRLQKIKKTTKVVNGSAWVAAVWLWFYPYPYEMAVVSNLVVPIIAILLLVHYKGLVKLFNETGAYPNLTYALIIPPLVVMVRVLLDYDVLQYQNGWIYTAFLAPLIYFLILKVVKEPFIALKKWIKVSNYFFLFVFVAVLVFFNTLIINCTFDESVPNVYETEVLAKKIVEGKYSTEYKLTVTEWGETTEPMDVRVTYNEYQSIQEGEEVYIYLKRGLLNIPWFFAGEK